VNVVSRLMELMGLCLAALLALAPLSVASGHVASSSGASARGASTLCSVPNGMATKVWTSRHRLQPRSAERILGVRLIQDQIPNIAGHAPLFLFRIIDAAPDDGFV